MIVIIDNYDSFTYNLVQYLGEMEGDVRVYRNDAIDVAGIRALKPDHLVVSPGPCTPQEAGISIEVIRELGPEIPTLGCAWDIRASARPLAAGGACGPGHAVNSAESTTSAMCCTTGLSRRSRRPGTIRGSSAETCPDELEIAETDDKIIMGVAHRHYPIWGVQYHPESILTKPGKQMLRNFLNRKAG